MRSSHAAIVVDPLSSGATSVTFGQYPEFPPYQIITNPVLDPLNNTGLMVVGNESAGRLEINGGSQANIGQIWIGIPHGSPGHLTIKGPGSKLSLIHSINVSSQGLGVMEILDGASVTARQLTISSGYTGQNQVALSGTASQLTLHERLSIGGANSQMTTSDGAQLTVPYVDLGGYEYPQNASAEAIVTTGSKWIVAGELGVGSNGNGKLTISDGGEVQADTTFINRWTPSLPVPLTLDDGTLQTNMLYLIGGGVVGSGSLSSKGLVADLDLIFDTSRGLVQELAIPGQPGVALALDHSAPAPLGAGYRGAGSLTIADGRQVVSTIGYLGYDGGGNGHAVVKGNGSRWETLGDLLVGRHGAGELKIESGASVQVGGKLLLGPSSGEQASRVILNGGDLSVDVLSASTDQLLGVGTIQTRGLRLDGTLEFDQPGTGVGNLVLDALPGQHVSVEFESPELSVLGVGYRGEGLMTIRNGAKVRSLSGVLGHDRGGKGTAIVAGVGSEWVIDEGQLVLGNDLVGPHATGKLQVVDGGLVQSDSIQLNADSQLEVAGAGSRVEAYSVDFGYSYYERFASVMVHSGGTLSVSHLNATGSIDQLSGRIDVEGKNSRIEALSGTDLDGVLVRVRKEATFDSVGLNLENSALLIDRGTVDVNGGRIDVRESQIIFEHGTLRNVRELDGDLWQTSGRVELGDRPAVFNGTYLVDEDATLQMKLVLDRMLFRARVNEFAVLEGTLEVVAAASLPAHAQPGGGIYNLLRAEIGIVGEFSDYLLPDLAEGLAWTVLQTDQELSLQVVAGDFNRDGMIDSADYTLWRNSRDQLVNFGSGADGNRDGYIDDQDYYLWKSFFGRRVIHSSIGGSAVGEDTQHESTAAVPEPASILLLATVGFSLFPVARRRSV